MSFMYNRGAYELANFFLVGGTAPAVKAILVTAAYADVADRDDDVIAQLNATRSAGVGATAEITATSGYVRGYSGSGRVTLATGVATETDADDAVTVDWADPAWTAMTTVDQIAGMVLAIERTSDGDSPLVAFITGSPLPTPAGGLTAQNFTFELPPGGILELLTNP